MKWLVPVYLIALLLAATPTVLALTPPPDQVRRSWQKRFEELDRNRDGRVSRAEYLEFFGGTSGMRRQYFEYEFRLYDRNGDGFISWEEHQTPVGPEDEFRALDRNGDGRLSREEFRFRYREQDFPRLDRNRDGYISREEFLQSPRHRR
ncbi:MAG: EF-hand domain-containing protein [Desulfobaccales bacterium]